LPLADKPTEDWNWFLGSSYGKLNECCKANQVINCVRFEVFTAVIMKNVVFCDIKSGSYFKGDILSLRYRVQPVNAM
jgi:hypothetical protein